MKTDVVSSARAPRDVQDFLLKKGGKNPFRKPNFRLSIAEGILKQRGSLWHKWPEGLITREQGGIHLNEDGYPVVVEADKPLSVDAEVRWVRKYPALKGWVLEEWHPSHMFGTREEWEAQKVPGYPNVPLLGPYPSEGLYSLSLPYGWGQPAAGKEEDERFKTRPGVPPVGVLEKAIDYVIGCREFWGRLTPTERRIMWEEEDLQRAALEKARTFAAVQAYTREHTDILLSSSLEAGRYREQLAREGGLKLGHVGN